MLEIHKSITLNDSGLFSAVNSRRGPINCFPVHWSRFVYESIFKSVAAMLTYIVVQLHMPLCMQCTRIASDGMVLNCPYNSRSRERSASIKRTSNSLIKTDILTFTLHSHDRGRWFMRTSANSHSISSRPLQYAHTHTNTQSHTHIHANTNDCTCTINKDKRLCVHMYSGTVCTWRLYFCVCDRTWKIIHFPC